MNKIAALTTEQQELLDRKIQYWGALGRSTEPLNRAAATEAICALYEAIGRKRPLVLFFSSPLMCILAWGALRSAGPSCWGQYLQRRSLFWASCVGDNLWELLDRDCFAWISFVVDQFLPDGTYAPVSRWVERRMAEPQLNTLYDELASAMSERRETMLDPQLDAHISRQIGESLPYNTWGWRLGRELEILLSFDEKSVDRFWNPLADQLAEQLRNHRREHLVDQVSDRLYDNPYHQVHRSFWGNWSESRVVLWDYCNSIEADSPAEKSMLDLWLTQRQHCHWWFPYERLVLVSERPRILRFDAAERLHNADGAAVEYADGYVSYAWHGVPVSPRLITDPASITLREIEREVNAEIRRVMLERYGWTRFMADSGANVVDSMPMDHPVAGLRGARLLVKKLFRESEPIVYLELMNRTPEADGTFKRYLQRIDPMAYNGDAGRLCHAALASLWHHRDDDGQLVRTFSQWQSYQPTAES